MAKGEELSLTQLSNETRVTYTGFPITIPNGGDTIFPSAGGNGIECGHKPKKSFTVETNGACTIYILGRIGTSGNFCTLKKNGTDADLTYSIAGGGGSTWFMCEAPIDYVKLWIVNTAGATLTVDDIKLKLGR